MIETHGARSRIAGLFTPPASPPLRPDRDASLRRSRHRARPIPRPSSRDLGFGDDQRRADIHRIGRGAEQDAAIHRALLDQRTDAGRGRQRSAACLVSNEVNGADQADATRLAHQRMRGERLQLLLQIGPTCLT